MKLTPEWLSEKTSGVQLPATFSAVTKDLERYQTFVSFLIPTGGLISLPYKEPLLLSLRNAAGAELERGRLLIGMVKPNGRLVKEFNQFGLYETYKSLGWANQLNSEFKNSLIVDTAFDEIILFEGESLVFQISDCDDNLATPPHASTRFKYPVSYGDMSDYLRLMQKQKKPMKGFEDFDRKF